MEDPDKAEELLKMGQAIEPENAQWDSRLGQLYSMAVSSTRPPDPKRAQRALDAYESGLAKLEGIRRNIMLIDAGKVAIKANRFDRAEVFATEIIQRAATTDSWFQGNMVHHGNLIMGHVAFNRGRTADAETYLLRAGATKGSSPLNSFGPNMSLARRLLESGRSEKVIQYLEACRAFWKLDDGKLDKWIGNIVAGRMPDFGANLDY